MSNSDWIKQTARRYQDVITGATYTQCVEFARTADVIINYALIGNPHGVTPTYGRDALAAMMFPEPLLYYPITHALGPEWHLAHIDQPGSASRWLQHRRDPELTLDALEAHDNDQPLLADPFAEGHTGLRMDVYEDASMALGVLEGAEITLPALGGEATIDEYLALLASVAEQAPRLNARIVSLLA